MGLFWIKVQNDEKPLICEDFYYSIPHEIPQMMFGYTAYRDAIYQGGDGEMSPVCFFVLEHSTGPSSQNWMATTSKEGSKCGNNPLPTQGGSDEK